MPSNSTATTSAPLDHPSVLSCTLPRPPRPGLDIVGVITRPLEARLKSPEALSCHWGPAGFWDSDLRGGSWPRPAGDEGPDSKLCLAQGWGSFNMLLHPHPHPELRARLLVLPYARLPGAIRSSPTPTLAHPLCWVQAMDQITGVNPVPPAPCPQAGLPGWVLHVTEHRDSSRAI